MVGGAHGQAGLNPLAQERTLERVRRPGDQNQDVEQGKGDRDAARPDASDAGRIGESANELDDEGQRTEPEQLNVHCRPSEVCGPSSLARTLRQRILTLAYATR